MMTFFYILAGLFVLLLILAAIAPKKYRVTRSTTINKPLVEVFDYIKHVKNQDHWSPWKKRDPNMSQEFIGQDGQVGFISKWDSDHKQVGSGEQEIISIDDNQRMETALRFLKPFKSVSTAFFETRDLGNGQTEVVWGFYGNNKFPFSIFMLFMNMDKAVGRDFEEGLSELKRILEARAFHSIN